jgi:hypothetical protein
VAAVVSWFTQAHCCPPKGATAAYNPPKTCASFHGSNIIPSPEQQIDLSHHVINTNTFSQSQIPWEIESIKIR